MGPPRVVAGWIPRAVSAFPARGRPALLRASWWAGVTLRVTLPPRYPGAARCDRGRAGSAARAGQNAWRCHAMYRDVMRIRGVQVPPRTQNDHGLTSRFTMGSVVPPGKAAGQRHGSSTRLEPGFPGSGTRAGSGRRPAKRVGTSLSRSDTHAAGALSSPVTSSAQNCTRSDELSKSENPETRRSPTRRGPFVDSLIVAERPDLPLMGSLPFRPGQPRL